MSEALKELGEHIADSCADMVKSFTVRNGELTILAERDSIGRLAKFLKDDNQCVFETMIDICGVDYPERAQRFEVVYHFLSMRLNQRIRVKVSTDEDTPVPSACTLFMAAEWNEREAWDMYGIFFSDHPDLRRLLTDYGFEGHPLRKDFPLTGHVEVRYDDEVKRVVYEPVTLTQDFRTFDFLSPWEGAQSLLPGDDKAVAADESGAD